MDHTHYVTLSSLPTELIQALSAGPWHVCRYSECEFMCSKLPCFSMADNGGYVAWILV